MAATLRLSLTLPLLAGAVLSGCTVGPDYAGPPTVAPHAAEANRFVRAGDTSVAQPAVARWWEGLNDPTLNALIEEALRNNPTLESAQARLRSARAEARQQDLNGLPKVNASAIYAHARVPGNLTGGEEGSEGGDDATAVNLYNVGFDSSWEIDLFGGQRRAREGSAAKAEARAADVADAQVSLAAEMARAYIGLRDAQHRLALNRRSLEIQQQSLDLARQRLERGTVSGLDVERLNGQVSITRSDLVPLNAQVTLYLNQIAVLAGQEPGAMDERLSTPAPIPALPAEVAIGSPADLLRRRPDIRAAERMLAASNAQIGVREAAMFPRLSFLGLIGVGGTRPEDLTHLDDFVALAAPQLQWNILDFGRNKAAVGQAKAERDLAQAQYREKVLAALQDAEDSLVRFNTGRQSVASLGHAKLSADRSVALMQQRVNAGTAALGDQLDTERQRIQTESALAQAWANLANSYVALQKSLGLGWTDAATMPSTPAGS